MRRAEAAWTGWRAYVRRLKGLSTDARQPSRGRLARFPPLDGVSEVPRGLVCHEGPTGPTSQHRGSWAPTPTAQCAAATKQACRDQSAGESSVAATIRRGRCPRHLVLHAACRLWGTLYLVLTNGLPHWVEDDEAARRELAQVRRDWQGSRVPSPSVLGCGAANSFGVQHRSTSSC